MAVWGQPLILPQVLSVWTGPASPQVLSVWIRDRFSSCFVCVDQHPLLLRFCLCGSAPGTPQILSVWISTRFSSGFVCVDQDPVLLRFCLWIRARFSSGSVCVDQGLVLLRFCLCGSGPSSPSGSVCECELGLVLVWVISTVQTLYRTPAGPPQASGLWGCDHL